MNGIGSSSGTRAGAPTVSRPLPIRRWTTWTPSRAAGRIARQTSCRAARDATAARTTASSSHGCSQRGAMAENNAVLTEAEKGRILYHMGYGLVNVADVISLGAPAVSQTLYL